MGLHASFDILSGIVDHYESRGRSIRHVEATPTDDSTDRLAVLVEVPLTLCSGSGTGVREGLSPESATLTENNGLQVEFTASSLLELPETAATALTTDETDVCVTDDGLLLTVEFTIDPSGAADRILTASDNSDDDSIVFEHVESSERSETATVSTENGDGDPAADERDPIDEALTTARDDSIPPYEDGDYLRQLYDFCDNFSEMSQRIPMDVSSETVRRYMIQANIHEPDTYETTPSVAERPEDPDGTQSEDCEATQPKNREETQMEHHEDSEDTQTEHLEDRGDTQTEHSEDRGDTQAEHSEDCEDTQTEHPEDGDLTASHSSSVDERLATDGIGLPEGVQITDVADAVVNSMTVYEVMRHLELERQETSEILKQLNLLDLVSRPLSHGPEEAVSYDTVASRIRQCGTSGA